MKKLKIGPSFFLLIAICLLTKNIGLLLNYFLALFLHEMAHLWVAAKRGYSLKQIKLDIFGLAVELNEKIDDKDQFAINIAGPVCNLIICVLCMASYWLFPISYFYLNTFCFSSLVLAIFNLLPVYPLDGGKIFCGIIKSDKAYKILNCLIRLLLAGVFMFAFVVSCFGDANFLLLALSVFFISNKKERAPTMSIFKYRRNKHFNKVVIIKVDEQQTLFNLIKQIKSYHYTIFYIQELNKFLDEDMVIEFSLNNSLETSVKDLELVLDKCNIE